MPLVATVNGGQCYWAGHKKKSVNILKCFTGLETRQEGSDQCELIKIASKFNELGAKLSVGRQIESEIVKCLREITARLTS